MNERAVQPLASVVSLVTDRVLAHKDPSRPYVGLEHIPSSGTSLKQTGLAVDSISTNGLFAAGDILFGKLRPRLRKCVRVTQAGYCSTDILVLRALPGVDPTFAGYVAQSDEVFRRAVQTEEGTKMPRCSWRDLRTTPVILPASVAEQKRIAAILTSIDNAIEATEALIEKHEQIKAGLMHDLFTRGVLPNGELRPAREHAPRLYRTTSIGFVPADWDIRALAALVSSDITYGIVQAGPHVDDGTGVPYVRTGDMSGDSLDRSQTLCTSRSIANAYKRSEIREGEIVMSIRASVGKVLPVPAELDGANLTQGTARIAPTSDVDSGFLLWAMRHERFQVQVLSSIKGTTFAEITLAALRQLPLAIPSRRDEQSAIAAPLHSHQQVIWAEQQQLAKLHLQRLGLMQDLLTGKVPVKLPDAAPEPVAA